MVHARIRAVMTVCGVAAMLLAVPAESRACCLLDSLFGWGRTTYRAPYVTTAYASAYAPAYAPACAPSCAPCVTRTCRYVPQTCYRTVCQRVPVTTCQALTYCDPCTGCPVTTYRPITTWTTQTRLVPYTTYRLMCSDTSPPYVSPATGVSYGVPAVGGAAAAGSCCGPQPGAAVVSPALPGPAPAGSVTPPSGVPKTFLEDNNSQPALEAVPDKSSDTGVMEPTLIPPATSPARPIRQTSLYRLISSPSEPVPVHRTRGTDGGWRAARK